MKTTITEKEFIENETSKIPNESKSFLDIEIVSKNLSLVYQENIKRTEDIDLAKDFQKHCPTKNGKTEDYLYKIVEIEGITFWLSLRFWNRDIGYPFIDILYFSCDIREVVKNVQKIYTDILTLYKNIEVKNVRLTFYEKDFDLLKEIEYEEDNLMVGKPIDKKNENYHTEIRIELLTELAEEDYTTYENEYNLFNKEHPSLNFVKAVKYETLQKRTKDGFVYKIYKDNNFIGLFAIVEDFYDTYYGYCVFEKIIFKDYRGFKYSLQAQNLIEIEISHKNETKQPYLIGTISPKNFSSLKSALKTGRKVLMKQVMIKPKGCT